MSEEQMSREQMSENKKSKCPEIGGATVRKYWGANVRRANVTQPSSVLVLLCSKLVFFGNIPLWSSDDRHHRSQKIQCNWGQGVANGEEGGGSHFQKNEYCRFWPKGKFVEKNMHFLVCTRDVCMDGSISKAEQKR